MPTPRRRAIRVLATAGLASVAGCASVINGTSNSGGDGATPAGGDGSPRRTRSADAADSTTPAADSTTPADAEEVETTEQWSIEDVTIEPPSQSFSSVPTRSVDATYPTMGSDDTAATATLFGNWKCPYTRDFVLEQLPGIVDEFVRPGDLQIEFRSLAYLNGDPFLGPDAPRAARAGLAVWELDPETFWQYFAYVFANQPQERHAWAQPDLLVRFAEAAEVSDPDWVRRKTIGGEFSELVDRTVNAAQTAGIGTVPRVLANGNVTAPTVDPGRTRTQLERAADQ